jgi:hypothetical protein
VLLWKGICQNKLLAKVDLVLFLNKCDILHRKLESGIRLARYVKSYDDRSNDMETASKCASIPPCDILLLIADSNTQDFRGKFSAIQRTYSPSPRRFYGYCTSVTVGISLGCSVICRRLIETNRKARQRQASLRVVGSTSSSNNTLLIVSKFEISSYGKTYAR